MMRCWKKAPRFHGALARNVQNLFDYLSSMFLNRLLNNTLITAKPKIKLHNVNFQVKLSDWRIAYNETLFRKLKVNQIFTYF
jgi:hypothetical protein